MRGRAAPPRSSRRRATLAALPAALLLAALLLVGVLLDASRTPVQAAGAAHEQEADALDGDAAEQELLRSLRTEKLIRARGLAERMLRARPRAVVAHYALARVFHDEEANLPRALYHARLAERHLLQQHGDPPRRPAAQLWHRKILLEQSVLLGEMDRREQQLAVLDRHDAHYRPRLDRYRIWPLMKLGRFEEAQRIARQAAISEDVHMRVTGLNGLIAIESERLRPRACFKVGLDAVIATNYRSCILTQNTAEAAFAVYRFDEVERLALRSLQAEMSDCPASAYPHLANLYLLRGDFQRAMQAVRSAREQGTERRYRQQFEMGNTAWLARLLIALGKFEQAEDLAARVLRTPDREGLISFSRRVMRLVNVVDYHAALKARAEEQRERASVRPILDRLGIWLSSRRLEQAAWAARRRATKILARPQELAPLVRPYFKPLPPWTSGELIDVVGAGILAEAVRQARAAETMPRETEPYFAALEGEAAHRGGRLQEALERGRVALTGLPRDEVLLRGRTASWTADAAWRLGRRKEAEQLFHEVLHRFPTGLRLLGIALPARILADSHSRSQGVARALLGSRRLAVSDDAPFVVRVTAAEKALRICLESREGRRYACAEPAHAGSGIGARPPDEAELVARAADEFHAKVFAPKVDLTQRDINSLDGSAIRGDADEVLRQVLGQ